MKGGLGPIADRKHFMNKAREWRRLEGGRDGEMRGEGSSPGWVNGPGGLVEWVQLSGDLDEAIPPLRIYSQEPIR